MIKFYNNIVKGCRMNKFFYTLGTPAIFCILLNTVAYGATEDETSQEGKRSALISPSPAESIMQPKEQIATNIQTNNFQLAPTLKKVGDKFILDKAFVESVPTYAKMADLSYDLIKGHVERSQTKLEEFQKAGWTIKGFDGISGRNDNLDLTAALQGKGFFARQLIKARYKLFGTKEEKGLSRIFGIDKTDKNANNRDLAGFVAFNPRTGEAVVAFHGSQDEKDWESNWDYTMVSARQMGFNFDGRVHHGFAERYISAKPVIEALLKSYYDSLPASEKNKFHITTTGHSLGAGVGTIAYADLSTNFAKSIWGKDYMNKNRNHIKAYVISPPRSFDEKAVDEITKNAGVEDIIIDTTTLDPVGYFGFGKTVTSILENASDVSLTKVIVVIAKFLGYSETSDPKVLANLVGGAKHLGYKAYQDPETLKAKVAALPYDPNADKRIEDKIKDTNFFLRIFARARNYIKQQVAPYHYSTVQAHGTTFDSRLLDASTLEDRINREQKENAASPKTPWYKIFQ